jgi:hypothetical protein
VECVLDSDDLELASGDPTWRFIALLGADELAAVAHEHPAGRRGGALLRLGVAAAQADDASAAASFDAPELPTLS